MKYYLRRHEGETESGPHSLEDIRGMLVEGEIDDRWEALSENAAALARVTDPARSEWIPVRSIPDLHESPAHMTRVESRTSSTQADATCPRCGSRVVVSGSMVGRRSWDFANFSPDGQVWWKMLFQGVSLDSKSQACLDCGFVFASVPPEELRNFVASQCDSETKKRLGL